MTIDEKAKILLDAFTVHAPGNINYNLEDMYLRAIKIGLRRIKKAEEEKEAKK